MSAASTPSSRSGLLASLGPGLLFAGTAVGVSHLVQSTRAGAGWGMSLIVVVLLANLLKYPAFEAGPRYAAATGTSLLQAYRDQGRWALWLFLALTFATMFTVLGAVTIVTAGMASAMISDALGPTGWSAILLLASGVLLGIGRFKLLESAMKILMLVLSVSTLIAVVLLVSKVDFSEIPWGPVIPDLDVATLAFLVALVGWMPTAIDIATWQSLWGLEKARSEGRKLEMRGALFDFKVGYIGTAVLALCFITMGAGVFYGSPQELPNQAGKFAVTFVDMYVQALEPWARPVVLVAAFSTMLSTTITCNDGFPRAVEAAVLRLRSDEQPGEDRTIVYWITLGVIGVGALLLISAFAKNLTGLVDLATTLSFLTAPVLAVLNYRALRSPKVAPEHRPRGWLLALHWIGMVFMSLFAAYYLWGLAMG